MNIKDTIKKCLVVGLLVSYFLFTALHLQQGIERYILLSLALFCIGVYGLTSSRNIIRILMSIEILLNAVNINLVAFSSYADPLEIRGQVFALFVMAIAAAEAAIALALILAIYRNNSSVDIEDLKNLKW